MFAFVVFDLAYQY